MKSFNLAFDKNKKEMEKIYVVLILETFIVLYKFKDLHSKFVSSELLKIVVKCSQKISELTHKITGDQSENRIGYNFTEQDVDYIERLVSLIIYEASYFSDTYEDLLSRPVL